MPSERDRRASALRDVIENIDAARRFVAGLNYEAFAENQEKVYAVTRASEIVSEASRQIPDAIKLRHPAIAWQQIKAAGNIYRHEYRGIDLRVVWDTVQRHLEPLRWMAEEELARLKT
jgi:uncharacterized protein with HEPN domain